MKHNKKRNTAFIYETLTRELTKAIVDKDATRKVNVLALLKEFFNQGQVLAKELELYRVLLETTNIQTKVAERLLAETKTAHGNLNESIIFDAQSRVIAAINKGLGKELWANFVPNFKSLASVNAIFNPKVTLKKKVLFEQAIVDRMSHAPESTQATGMQPIDSLTYNSFIKKFNKKFGVLLREQKELLNHFVTSFADDGFELRVYLNEELSRLKQTLGTSAESAPDTAISQKVNEVIKYLEGFRHRDFTADDLSRILKTQELVEELAAHD